MLQVMIEKLADRKERINDAISGKSHIPAKNRVLSDEELFRLMGKKVTVIKHD